MAAHAPRDSVADRIRAAALKIGFDDCGFTSVDAVADAGARLHAFLAADRHGEMTWLAETADRRASPRALWPAARSAIVVAQNYAPEVDPMDRLSVADRGVISAYAKRRDYHEVIKGRLKHLAQQVVKLAAAEVKVFVDTAPLMEKPLAGAAGLGWQGKHTNLVSRAFGSWTLLGVVLTDAELLADAPSQDHCGSCRRCLDVCPTDAFPAPYQLDARRCLAYLSIEHAGPIPEAFRKPMGNRVFGCDDCLAVCPWNRFAQPVADARMALKDDLDDPPLLDLLALDDAAFRKRFAGTPVKRTGRDRFLRNVVIAAGNATHQAASERARLVAGVRARLEDESPLVRGMAVWALDAIGDNDGLAEARKRAAFREHDAHVRAEWRAAGFECEGES